MMINDTPTPTPQPPTLPLILASQSPRRAQLLRDAGFTFTQQSPPFADPDQPEAQQPHSLPEAERYAADLAKQKAVSMVHAVPAGYHGLILAADTLCVSMSPGHEGTLIGKPRDQADARAMLLGFMNSAHAVVSGVALLEVGAPPEKAAARRDAGRAANSREPTLLADTAVVTFGQVADVELDRYLDSTDWQGKAGGYNLFDRQQAGWPITVKGDPTTVVGLPMGKLGPALQALSVTVDRRL